MGLMRGAIEFGQWEHVAGVQTSKEMWEHVAGVQTSKEMWDHLCKIHVTQHQGINVHYYYQDLYAKKWDECTCMSDHIRSSLSLCHQIIKAGQKIEDTHIVYVILLSVPHTGIWDLIKQNHLDKRKGLTLDMVTAELIAIHDRAEWNQVTDKA